MPFRFSPEIHSRNNDCANGKQVIPVALRLKYHTDRDTNAYKYISYP